MILHAPRDLLALDFVVAVSVAPPADEDTGAFAILAAAR